MAQKAKKVPVGTKKKGAEVTVSAPTERGMLETVHNLREEVDRVFERAFRGWPTTFSFPRHIWDFDPFRGFRTPFALSRLSAIPQIDVREGDKAYEVTVELPGVEEKDLNVTVSDDRLTVRGEKKSTREEKKKDYHISERQFGMFERTMALPADVDAKDISAEFKDGVLTITLPKSAAAKPKERKVTIKSR